MEIAADELFEKYDVGHRSGRLVILCNVETHPFPCAGHEFVFFAAAEIVAAASCGTSGMVASPKSKNWSISLET